MDGALKSFCVNTYSYTLNWRALDCISHISEQGYSAAEVMMYPGHLWPEDIDNAGRRDFRVECQRLGVRLTSLNMPNIDINLAAATREMREYTLDRLVKFTQLACDLEIPYTIIGIGKSNPLLSPPLDVLLGHMSAGLDRIYKVAKPGGTKILLENMPFAFLPSAEGLLTALMAYGNEDIGIIYDVANGHFIGKDPRDELRMLAPHIGLIHFSDTGRKVYKHDPIGAGDVPFRDIAPVVAEIGYRGPLVLEIISHDPDDKIRESVRQLTAMGYAGATAANASA